MPLSGNVISQDISFSRNSGVERSKEHATGILVSEPWLHHKMEMEQNGNWPLEKRPHLQSGLTYDSLSLRGHKSSVNSPMKVKLLWPDHHPLDCGTS